MNYVRRRLSGSGRAGEARVARRGAHDACSREIPEAANATFHTDKKTEQMIMSYLRPDRAKSRLISIPVSFAEVFPCTYSGDST